MTNNQTNPVQSEYVLEEQLIDNLVTLKYERVFIKNENELIANLKKQLEVHNKVKFSDTEFKFILNHLNKGNIFERAKILRDKVCLVRDDGTNKYIEFLNTRKWCQNQYQVTNQVSMEGKYKNRYDVTLLINGLPLVQIELKRSGLELKEAFNQIQRYQSHSFNAKYALFNYVQIFIISNGVNTKYYANCKKQSFKQTFYWADENNKTIRDLQKFTFNFLEPCHISKMICRYTVLSQSAKILMVLRPYQYYAVENIIKTVDETNNNGYIWHTTGSGKTLTSFKASQILMTLPGVKKIVFVVDRKDLDYQTTKEFNSFSEGSVDGTDNTKQLVKQFSDSTKLIVTTIQKLNTAISKDRYLEKMNDLKDKKTIFIFDECHRSQFGETHKRITSFFNNYQMFGFTGTPIFKDNATSFKTTSDLFSDCLHKYVITDAIKDENVLKFSIEYIGKYKKTENCIQDNDIEVENIDTKELLESNKRTEKIVDYILDNHNKKTHSKNFTAMFCISSIDMLIKYYDLFKQKDHKLKIATIFSYSANEEDKNANGLLDEEIDLDSKNINVHSREKLDEFITDYNQMFGSKYSTKDSKSFYNYYNDIAKRVKSRDIDILLVVGMFLTGFNSPSLNTLYVDKNLKYHGLIQAFSRTNRILNEQKSQGNIVCFRNLKEETDKAITLFSNKDAKDTILLKSYEEYIKDFDTKYQELLNLTPTLESVDNLKDEQEEFQFITSFRNLIRAKNILNSFIEFKFDDLAMSEQSFENYKSKYLDLYDKVKTNRETEAISILDDVDFELELIHKDEINVTYILNLLSKIKEEKDDDKKAKKIEAVKKILDSEVSLRSKKELIEKFIDQNLLQTSQDSDIDNEFDNFWQQEQIKAFNILCQEEDLDKDKFQNLVDNSIFTNRLPLGDNIIKSLNQKPKLLKRKSITSRITKKLQDFINTFMKP